MAVNSIRSLHNSVTYPLRSNGIEIHIHIGRLRVEGLLRISYPPLSQRKKNVCKYIKKGKKKKEKKAAGYKSF